MMTNPSRFRAWRFGFPEIDAPVGEVGLQVGPGGGIAMVAEEASVRQAILMLLSTAPGERVMRPEYGCALHFQVFSPNDATTAGLAIHYVGQALARWEPRIEILTIDAEPHPGDPGRMDVTLEYRMRSSRRIGRLSYPIQLSGEEI